MLHEAKEMGINIYGTLLDGENIYQSSVTQEGIIVMGNEGRGVSEECRKMLTHKLLIPPYPADSPTSESLNVAMATGIILSEFRRRE
jgi:TrmH family RNA methyltransferase